MDDGRARPKSIGTPPLAPKGDLSQVPEGRTDPWMLGTEGLAEGFEGLPEERLRIVKTASCLAQMRLRAVVMAGEVEGLAGMDQRLGDRVVVPGRQSPPQLDASFQVGQCLVVKTQAAERPSHAEQEGALAARLEALIALDLDQAAFEQLPRRQHLALCSRRIRRRKQLDQKIGDERGPTISSSFLAGQPSHGEVVLFDQTWEGGYYLPDSDCEGLRGAGFDFFQLGSPAGDGLTNVVVYLSDGPSTEAVAEENAENGRLGEEWTMGGGAAIQIVEWPNSASKALERTHGFRVDAPQDGDSYLSFTFPVGRWLPISGLPASLDLRWTSSLLQLWIDGCGPDSEDCGVGHQVASPTAETVDMLLLGDIQLSSELSEMVAVDNVVCLRSRTPD